MPQATEVLMRVESPRFVAALILKDGVCVKAAPILKWAVGSGKKGLEGYFRGRGWKFQYLEACDEWDFAFQTTEENER